MSYPGYDKGPNPSAPAEPPAYTNIPPYGGPPPLVPSDGQFPHASYGAMPGMPPHMQGPMVYAPQQVVLVSPPAVKENDYLGYSIFTLLCCCLPLGIVALVYSIQTRDANHAGNAAQAKRSSRMAQIFNHTALAVGIVLMIVWIALVVTITVMH